MNHSKSLALAASSLVMLGALSVQAEPTPEQRDTQPQQKQPAAFQLSLWSSTQIVDKNRAIHGFRLNLPYGENRELEGFDLGIASYTTGHLYGAQLGLGGYVEGEVRGMQHNFVLSIARENLIGWQEGFYVYARGVKGAQTGFVNHSGAGVDGLQLGVVNLARGATRGAEIGGVNVLDGDVTGLELAIVNVSRDSSRGASIGFVNYARRIEGVQIGLVNVTGELHGIQIGVANIASNAMIPVLPIMNAAL